MINTISPPCSPGFNNIYSFDATMHRIDNFSTSAGIQTVDFNINSSTINVEKNDTIDIRFKNVSTTTANFTASFSNAGSLYISSLSLTTGYASTNCPYFNSASMAALSTDPSNDNVVIFANGISGFHGGNYSFIPNPLTGSLNSLYSTYGDVDYPFSIKPYDVLIVYLSDNTYVESRILEVIGGGNQPLKIRLENPLSSLLRSNLTVSNGNYKSFLILSKIPDETSAYLTFKKRDGKTSYGFIIPNDIAPDVLANMDTITKEVKQKLINEQAVINDINGGTFS
jgi:cold shock CspA family protein